MIEWNIIKDYTQIPPRSVTLTDTEYPIDLQEVILSKRDVEKEIRTGKPCRVRINVEEKDSLGKGYTVYPGWNEILDEIGDRGI